MQELSLNILDVVGNSTKAGATKIDILLNQQNNRLTIRIIDNGCGMDEQTVLHVTDPFYTTRTTRKVGLGIPFFKESAEQTGGSFEIKSHKKTAQNNNSGTVVTAVFNTDHIDFTPLGDIVSTVCTLIQGAPNVDFNFEHKVENRAVTLNTAEIRNELGDDIPLNSPEVIAWISESLKDEYKSLQD